MTNCAESIIDKFGGVRPAAAALGIPPTTVQGWKSSGHIPARRQSLVLSKARERGLDLSPADFFQTEPAEREDA